MIAFLLAAAAMQAPAAPPIAETRDEEVLVLGRKLKNWRGRVSDKSGGACVTKRSTGDREVDAIGCAAMDRCYPAARTQFIQAQDKRLSRRARKQIVETASKSMGSCVFGTRARLLEELADRRYEASRR